MPRDIEEVLTDLRYGLKALRTAQTRYEVAQAYYEGDDPELFISDSLRIYLREEVAAFRANYASVPVNAVADRLYIAQFTSPDAATQAEIDRIVADNNLWAWSNDAMRDGEMYGDEYIGVWRGTDDRPVLSPLDPLSTRIIYDDELERIPEYLVREWIEGDDENGQVCRATISYVDEIYKFYRPKNSGANEWQPYEVDGEPWPLPNEMQDIPTGHLRNGMPYGSPGHKKSYGMQQMITKAILNMAANMDFMGFKQRYALKNPETLEVGAMPAPAPRTKNGEPIPDSPMLARPALTSGPGKLWTVSADAVGEFSPTDVDQFIKLLDWCKRAMANVERMPVREFDDFSGQAPSGESYNQSDRPMRNRVASRKRSFAAGWVKTMQLALSIVDPARNWGPVEVEWIRDDLSTDKTAYEAAALAAALVLQAINDPRMVPFISQKLQELGYSEAEVQSFLVDTNPSLPATNGINDKTASLDTATVE